MKKWIALYITGALLTNSYVRIHRYDAWVERDRKVLGSYNPVETADDVKCIRMGNDVISLITTILWPAYLAVRASDAIVSTKLKIEAPAILK